MGCTIALAYAFAGLTVSLVDAQQTDATEKRKAAAFELIGSSLDFLIAQGAAPATHRAPVLDRIAFIPLDQAEAAYAKADIVVEAILEKLDAKQAIFRAVSAAARPNCIIGSTTSTIAPDDLASAVSHPARYMNIHWINPAHISPLVELQPGAATDPALVEDMRVLHEKMGKVPLVCSPTPGYVMPRLQLALMVEAARIVEEGVASPADVDKAMRWGLGIRYANMGITEFIDWGGLEILFHAGNYMAGKLGDRFRPPALVQQKMQAGETGVRTGRGLNDWNGVDVPAKMRATQEAIFGILRANNRMPKPDALKP
jgi:3-hydroxybutyryl-CoA dehydrogenase